MLDPAHHLWQMGSPFLVSSWPGNSGIAGEGHPVSTWIAFAVRVHHPENINYPGITLRSVSQGRSDLGCGGAHQIRLRSSRVFGGLEALAMSNWQQPSQQFRTHGSTRSLYKIVVIVVVERYESLALVALRGREVRSATTEARCIQDAHEGRGGGQGSNVLDAQQLGRYRGS